MTKQKSFESTDERDALLLHPCRNRAESKQEMEGNAAALRSDEAGGTVTGQESKSLASQSSSGDDASMIAMKSSKRFSVEEVYAQHSRVRTPSIEVPSSITVRLTPISEMACRRHGVHPETLKDRPFKSFRDKDGEEEIQRLRHQAYHQRRNELMQIVTREKEKLLSQKPRRKEEQNNEVLFHRSNESLCSESSRQKEVAYSAAPIETAPGSNTQETNALIEQERRRLEKIKLRQYKEIQNVLDFERKMRKLEQEKLENEDRAVKEEGLRRRALEQRRKTIAEERRQKELQCRDIEAANERRRRKKELENFERDRRFLAEKEQERKLQQKKAQRLEVARREKFESLRQEKEMREEMEKSHAEMKMKLRNAKELEKQMQLEQKRQQEQLEAAQRRETAALRIARNQRMASELHAQRKTNLERNMQRHDELRHKKDFQKEQELEARRLEREMFERSRMLRLQVTRLKEDEQKNSLLAKFKEEEHHVALQRDKRRRGMKIEAEKKEIRRQLKQDTANRIKRKQEYEREKALKKIEQDDLRTQAVLGQRDELVQQRKKAAREAKIQKDALFDILEKSKMTNAEGGLKLQRLLDGSQNNEEKVNEIPKKSKRVTITSRDHTSGPRHVGTLVDGLYPGRKEPVKMRNGDATAHEMNNKRSTKESLYLVDLTSSKVKP